MAFSRPQRIIPDYSGSLGRNDMYRSLAQAAAPGMRYTQKNRAPIAQRGVVNFNGYQIPVALLAQMRYEEGINRGRSNVMDTYLGGKNQFNKRDLTSSDEVRKAYLRKIAPRYQGSGAMTQYQQAVQERDKAKAQIDRGNLQQAKKMGAQYKPGRTYAQETLSATGRPNQATQQARQQRKQRQQQFERNRQLAMQKQKGRRNVYDEQNVNRRLAEDMTRLRNIKPTKSNIQIRENVKSI